MIFCIDVLSIKCVPSKFNFIISAYIRCCWSIAVTCGLAPHAGGDVKCIRQQLCSCCPFIKACLVFVNAAVFGCGDL